MARKRERREQRRTVVLDSFCTEEVRGGAWGMGHGAWGMEHGAWGMGHGGFLAKGHAQHSLGQRPSMRPHMVFWPKAIHNVA